MFVSRRTPRIGVLTYGLDRAPTGIGRYTIELLRAFAKFPERPEIVLLTTERLDRAELLESFEHHPLPGCRLLPALLTYGNLAVSFAARRYRLDLVHDPNGIAPFLGPSGGARRVVTIHDACAYVHPKEHNRLDNWRYRVLLPRAARNANLVLTDSAHSQQDLARYLGVSPTRSRVVACGVSSRFRPVPAGEERRAVLACYGISEPYILYVGAVNARKNIVRLLEAYARLRLRFPRISLVVAGKRQWQTAEIDRAFGQLTRQGQIHFIGYVNDSDLPALYSAAEVFVFPSLYEGFGLPVLEAMACGTPVIASRSSSIPEVVGDAAILVDPIDVDSIAAGIERALCDPAMAATLRSHGVARARAFSWERAARETLELYQRVLNNDLERSVG